MFALPPQISCPPTHKDSCVRKSIQWGSWGKGYYTILKIPATYNYPETSDLCIMLFITSFRWVFDRFFHSHLVKIKSYAWTETSNTRETCGSHLSVDVRGHQLFFSVSRKRRKKPTPFCCTIRSLIRRRMPEANPRGGSNLKETQCWKTKLMQY